MNRCTLIALYYEPQRLKRTAALVRKISTLVTLSESIAVINGERLSSISPTSLLSATGAGRLVLHDNSGMEFGGYQAGVNKIQASFDTLIVLNDTVNSHSYMGPQLLSLLRDISEADGFGDGICGFVCNTPRRVVIRDLSATRFVRSNIMFIGGQAVAGLRNLIYDASLDKLIVGGSEISTFFHPELHRSASQHIERWLFSAAPESWYKAEPLSGKNNKLMASKAKSILQEFYLSMRIEANFGAVVYPNYSVGHRVIDKLWRPFIVGFGNRVPL